MILNDPVVAPKHERMIVPASEIGGTARGILRASPSHDGSANEQARGSTPNVFVNPLPGRGPRV